MVEQRASSGGGTDNASSGSGKPANISSGMIEPRPADGQREEALDQLVHLANVLGVDLPVDASLDTVQAALADSYPDAGDVPLEGEEVGLSQLSDEALLMADEMLTKHYPLPEVISERTIRLAHQRAKKLEQYAEETLFGGAVPVEETKLGELEMEVFAPGQGHSVEPLDVNDVGWENPLLPATNFQPLAAGNASTTAMLLAFSFAVIVFIVYFFKKFKVFKQLAAGKQGFAAFRNQTQIFTDQDEMRDQQPAGNWRDKIISALKAIGQLKRKGKFDTGSEFMNKNAQKAQKKPKKVHPGKEMSNIVDRDGLLGNPKKSKSKKAPLTVDEINSGLESANSGTYSIPTEFPLEAKLAQAASSDLINQPGSEEQKEPESPDAIPDDKDKFVFEQP